MTVKFLARRSTYFASFQAARVCPPPCSSSSAGPLPVTSYAILVPSAAVANLVAAAAGAVAPARAGPPCAGRAGAAAGAPGAGGAGALAAGAEGAVTGLLVACAQAVARAASATIVAGPKGRATMDVLNM